MREELRYHLCGQILENPKTGKRFYVKELLYEGGMAYIYGAVDMDLQTEVVVKANRYGWLEGDLSEAEVRERVWQRRRCANWEFHLLTSIHNNLSSAVPQLIDYLELDSRHPWIVSRGDRELLRGETYLVLERLTGLNLNELCLPLSVERGLRIGLSLSLFLELIHRQGYIYSSLIPENIILGEDGQNVSILDFDSVIPLDRSLRIGGGEGGWSWGLEGRKRAFLPSEGWEDIRVDVYSLGAILYYLLTGLHPGEVGFRFDRREFRALPEGVQSLVRRCLAPLVHRYSTAEEVSIQLRQLLGAEVSSVCCRDSSFSLFPIPPRTFLGQGRYRVLKGLSTGGQGRVYIAQNVHTKSKVLIKTPYLDRGYWSELGITQREALVEEGYELLHLERDMLCKFHTISSMVPQPLDFFEDRSYELWLWEDLPSLAERAPYLVLEFMQGYTLDRVSGLSVRESLWIVDRLCHILGCFHRNGYIYQDLKLANIIVDERVQNVYLIDMASLCPLDPVRGVPREDSVSCGVYTPGYRAPEWLEGVEFCDHRVDIYSLGATLWALLSGEDPSDYFRDWEKVISLRYRRGEIGRRTYDRCVGEAESPRLPLEKLRLSSRERELGVEGIVVRSLARSPQERYGTMEEMREEIRRVLERL